MIGTKPIREALADHLRAPKAGAPRRERANGNFYTVRELAAEWGLSTDKIRELFRNEAGVIKLTDENAKRKRKRSYVTLRIPPRRCRAREKEPVLMALEIYRRHNPVRCNSTDTKECQNKRRPCPIWIPRNRSRRGLPSRANEDARLD